MVDCSPSSIAGQYKQQLLRVLPASYIGRKVDRSTKASTFMNPPEFEVLLHCARSSPDAGAVRDLVSKGVDWHVLLKLAAQHWVRPMFLQSLKLTCWDSVPPQIQLELMQFNRRNVQKNLLFLGELLRLLSLFKEEGLPVAAFKGPVIAQMLYGHLSLREFADLDIIVQETDLLKAEEILSGVGYQADFADRAYRSAFLSYQRQYAFRNRKTGISVDLHWELASKGVAFPFRSEEIWSKLKEMTIAGRTILTLADDDLALFLAAHGTKEGWRNLIWITDFAELMRKYRSTDWMAVYDRAQRCHCSRPLLLATALASSLLDAPAPDTLISRARENSAVRALTEEANLRLLRAAPEEKFKAFLQGLKTHDRLRHRLLPIATALTTRTVNDFQTMPLPKWLWGIYYFTRPFRLAIKVAIMMLRSKKNHRF